MSNLSVFFEFVCNRGLKVFSPQEHQGALYLGVNGWQSPNGFDILGTVIYRLAEDDKGNVELEAMPLDFVCLSAAHTGEYLAESVRMVVEKFGIQNKVSVSFPPFSIHSIGS